MSTHQRRRYLAHRVAVFVAASMLALNAYSIPLLDASFGSNGVTRVAGPAKADDTPTTAAVQRDDKLIIAGRTGSSASCCACVRTVPPTQASAMPACSCFKTPAVASTIRGRSKQAVDVSLVLAGRVGTDYGIVRVTVNGTVDSNFGKNGLALIARADAYVSRFVLQPDGGIVVVTDATQGSNFALRLFRFTTAGVRDGSVRDQRRTDARGTSAGFFFSRPGSYCKWFGRS